MVAYFIAVILASVWLNLALTAGIFEVKRDEGKGLSQGPCPLISGASLTAMIRVDYPAGTVSGPAITWHFPSTQPQCPAPQSIGPWHTAVHAILEQSCW